MGEGKEGEMDWIILMEIMIALVSDSYYII